MARADALYVALIAIGLSVDSFVLWPAFLRRSKRDASRARIWLWSSAMTVLWTLAAGCVVLWMVERRGWPELMLVVPHGWRVLGTIALLLSVVIIYARPVAKITRRRSKRIRVSPAVAQRAPHTRRELACFLLLSLSAGFCEELIFRGYLIWLFQSVLGVGGAAAISLVVFAAAHAYQGAKGVVAVAVVGCSFTLIVIAFGSLVPAMAVHTLADVGEGVVAWLALRGMQTTHVKDSQFGEQLLAGR